MKVEFKGVIAEILVSSKNKKISLGTAFYIGNKFFISAYHCVREHKNAQLFLRFAETSDEFPIKIVDFDASMDIVLFFSQNDVDEKKYIIPFIPVTDIKPKCEFWLAGYGDRERYSDHVPAPACGIILDVIDCNHILVLQGSGLYMGMSGAPIIVGTSDDPRIAGMLKWISDYRQDYSNDGANRGIAVSSFDITNFLSHCISTVNPEIADLSHRHKNADFLCELILRKKKIIINGIKGIGKYFLFQEVLSQFKCKIFIDIVCRGMSLNFSNFFQHPQVVKRFNLSQKCREDEYVDFLNDALIRNNQLSEIIILIRDFSNVDVSLLDCLAKLNIAIVILSEFQIADSTAWEQINILPLSKRETAQFIQKCSVNRKIEKLTSNQFEKLTNDIFLACSGIPLLIKWVCAEINSGRNSAYTAISELSDSSIAEKYFVYLKNTFADFESEIITEVLIAIAISKAGISKEILCFVTNREKHDIDRAVTYLIDNCLIVDSQTIEDAELRYSTYQIIYEYCVQKYEAIVTSYIKRYIDYFSDYAKKNDYELIDPDELWMLFLWSEKYHKNFFLNWMFTFSYYFFETGQLSVRKEIGRRAQKICEENGNHLIRLWAIINEIAYLDYIQGNYNEAESLLKNHIGEAKELAIAEKDYSNRFNGKFILGLGYRYLGLVLSKKGLYKEAYDNFDKAMTIFLALNRIAVLENTILELGEMLLVLGNFDFAFSCFRNCEFFYKLDSNRKPWMSSWLARTYLDLAKWYYINNCNANMTKCIVRCEELLNWKESKLVKMELNIFLCDICSNDLKQSEYYWGIAQELSKFMNIELVKSHMRNTMKHSNLVFILTKYPYSGESKTRLIKDIGYEKATEIAAALLKDVTLTLSGYQYDLLVCPPESDLKYEKEYRAMLPSNIEFSFIMKGGLRGKESNLYDNIVDFFNNYKKVMFVFSDTPFIMPNIVLECFDKLDEQDIVIGSDGGEGYYLVGMSQPYDIFSSLSNLRIPYLSATLEILDSLCAKYSVVHPLRDLDTLQDISLIPWDQNKNCWINTQNKLIEFGLITPTL